MAQRLSSSGCTSRFRPSAKVRRIQVVVPSRAQQRARPWARAGPSSSTAPRAPAGEIGRARPALHLRVVDAGNLVARVQEVIGQRAVIGEEQQRPRCRRRAGPPERRARRPRGKQVQHHRAAARDRRGSSRSRAACEGADRCGRRPARARRPSTTITSRSGSACAPGSRRTVPLTVTRPSARRVSAPRRELSPAWARILLRRIGGTGQLRRRARPAPRRHRAAGVSGMISSPSGLGRSATSRSPKATRNSRVVS